MKEQQKDNVPVFHLNDFLRRPGMDKQTLQEHLQTLETLGLVQYQSEDRESFSLTESGKLANIL